MKKIVAIFTLVLSAGLIGRAVAEDAPKIEKQPGELFKKLDTNGDGVLTASEVPKEHQKLFERLLRIGDANKDGKLSREEFDGAIQKSEKPVTDIDQTPGVNPGAGRPKRKADPKQIFARLDKNKDGKLTSDEVENRPRIKALFDRQGKDSMTLDELTTALQNPGKKANKKKIAKQAAKQAAAGKTPASTPVAENEKAADTNGLPEFARLLDTNHDGRLSREELSKAAELFDRLDVNHDGVLDAKELTNLPATTSTKAATTTATTTTAPAGEAAGKHGKHGKHGKGAGANLAKLFQKADKDGDGKLTMEEAPRAVKKHFAKIDTNGDGVVDKNELEAWFRGHHHKKMAGKTPKAATPDNDAAQAG